MKLGENYSFINFLDEMEADGTVYISCDKEIFREIELDHIQEQGKKISKKDKKLWMMKQFCENLPLVKFLVFGKKTKYNNLRVRLYEEADIYEISFNFWDLIEIYPRDEASAIDEIFDFINSLKNYLAIDEEIWISSRRIANNTEIHFSLYKNKESKGNIGQFTESIKHKSIAEWFVFQLLRTASLRGMSFISFNLRCT